MACGIRNVWLKLPASSFWSRTVVLLVLAVSCPSVDQENEKLIPLRSPICISGRHESELMALVTSLTCPDCTELPSRWRKASPAEKRLTTPARKTWFHRTFPTGHSRCSTWVSTRAWLTSWYRSVEVWPYVSEPLIPYGRSAPEV